MMHRIFYLLSGFFICGAVCSAAQPGLKMTVDRSVVRLGDTVELALVFNDTANVPAPSLGGIEGFDVRYNGPSSQVSIINGAATSSITHRYTLIPLKSGDFNIGPFEFKYKGSSFRTDNITIKVTAADQNQSGSSLQDYVFLKMTLPSENVYVNQRFKFKVNLYVHGLTLRNIQYPRLEVDGLIISDFKNTSRTAEVLSGVEYEVIEFTATAFASRSGKLLLGPCLLDADMVVNNPGRRNGFSGGLFDSFFDDVFSMSSLKNITIRSKQDQLTVLDVPLDGRPADFSGIIGRVSFDAYFLKSSARAGDPLTFICRIGSEDTQKIPALSIDADKNDFKVYSPQEKTEQGCKIFEYAVIPLRAGNLSFPSVTLSYFDPGQGRYISSVRGPFELNIEKAEDVVSSVIIDSDDSGLVSRRTSSVTAEGLAFIKRPPEKMRKNSGNTSRSLLFVDQLLPALMYFLFSLWIRHDQRLKTDRHYAGQFKAPRIARKGLTKMNSFVSEGKDKEFFESVHNTIIAYIANKMHIPAGSIDSGTVKILSDKGLDRESVRQLSEILDMCDMARFGGVSMSKEQKENVFAGIKKIITKIERLQT